jgi:hypothetical protein
VKPVFQIGDKVLVGGVEGIYRGPNPKIPGDLWIEFPDTGWWSYDPSDVSPASGVEPSGWVPPHPMPPSPRPAWASQNADGVAGTEEMQPFWCHEQSHDRPRCQKQCAECADVDGVKAAEPLCLTEEEREHIHQAIDKLGDYEHLRPGLRTETSRTRGVLQKLFRFLPSRIAGVPGTFNGGDNLRLLTREEAENAYANVPWLNDGASSPDWMDRINAVQRKLLEVNGLAVPSGVQVAHTEQGEKT